MATKFTRPASLNFLVFIAIICGTYVEISAGRYEICNVF